mgnify:CR=1 FL=1
MKHSTLAVAVVLLAVFMMSTAFQCGSADVTSAKLYESRQDYEKAEASYLKEVTKNPSNHEAWYLLGRIRAQRGDYKGMKEAFDKMLDEDDVRTMMGIGPEQAAEFMARHGCDIAGLNCGTGVDMRFAADITRRYRATCGLPVMAQPNAGAPVLEDMKVLYKQTPEEMGEGLLGLLAAGPRIVGGCCGSTPAHIRRFREILDRMAAESGA